MMLRLVIYTVIIVFVVSCGIIKKSTITNTGINQISVTKVLNILDDNNRNFDDLFYAKAKFNVNTQQINQNFSGTIRIKNNSEIWVTVNAFLGIEVAKLHFTKDSVFIKSNLEKKLYVFSYMDVYNKFGVEVNYNILQSLLTYNFKFQKLGMYTYEYKPDGITLKPKEKYQKYLGYNNFTASQVLNTLAVSNIIYCAQQQNDCVHISYHDFYNYGDNVVPNVLAIGNNNSTYNVDIFLGKQSVSTRSESLGNVNGYKILKP